MIQSFECEKLTVLNFEYAVTLAAPIVALFHLTDSGWEYVTTARRWSVR
ncbi:MAG: hypothetical protein KME45_03245 [Stenomitos rutilans HA7619-LM2]|jgi:predicted choloylglycine hydrolase|nr:hypothetical protein [Stenomitos rutilans HA7619-LM2]MBW4469400.1 hypothetical protein [Stenomitos rutilans HA7619-LM2]